MKRRTFLYGSISLIGAISGCCPIRRSAAEDWSFPIRSYPLKTNVQPKNIPLALDVHAHLFNATDVPVKGYLEGPVAHAENSPLKRELIKAAGPFAERISKKFAIRCRDELGELEEKLRTVTFNPSFESNIRDEIENDIQAHLDRISNEIIKELPDSEFGKKLDEADAEYQRSNGLSLLSTPISKDPDRIRRALREGTEAKEKSLIDIQKRDEPSCVLTFVRYMLSPRHHNLISFQKSYSSDDGAFGIDACFSSLVDFDYWLDCCRTPSPLQDQVSLHEKLAILSGGYVLPLAPYNPWTDIKNNNESLNLVKDAIFNRGFVGVKIYPPMGFSPLGNSNSKIKRNRPDGGELDEKLCHFYDWCLENDVPIMAHTAHSMGRDDNDDNRSDPRSWASVLEKFPGIRVNAAHFGGGYYAAEERRYWPREFAQLMNDGNGRFLYADLGHEEEILIPESQEAARLSKLLTESLPGNPKDKVYSRVMYGSDWLMLSRIKQWNSYPHEIQEHIKEIAPSTQEHLLKSIFYENAVKLFGLSKGNKNRARLDEFYKKWNVATPTWMEKLDKLNLST